MLKVLLARALLFAIVCLALALLAIESAEAQLALTGMGGGATRPPAPGVSPLSSAAIWPAAAAAVAALWAWPRFARRR